jgi:hypothetical protein
MTEYYPDNKAVETWAIDDMIFYLVQQEDVSAGNYFRRGHFCGYVRFGNRPLKEDHFSGIATYVPVHGGITFASEDDRGFIYGFDCAHCDDEDNPQMYDLIWLRAETERMGIAIKVAAEFEDAFLATETVTIDEDGDEDKEVNNQARAEVLDAYHGKLRELDIDFHLTDNFMAMINVIFGSL